MAAIPYVISTAYPDYKRPSLHQEFGVCLDIDFPNLFTNSCADFIFYRVSDNDIETPKDIESFFDNYYDEYYMGNNPWDANIFIDGEWRQFIPSYEDLFHRILFLKKQDTETETDNEFTDKNEYNNQNNELKISEEDREFVNNFYSKLKEASNYEENNDELSLELREQNFIKHILSTLNENFVKDNKEMTKTIY